jgi:hypothetical protein
MSDENTLRSQLWASSKRRALAYLDVYCVLGEGRATELLKKPVYRRGCDIGRRHPFIEKGV